MIKKIVEIVKDRASLISDIPLTPAGVIWEVFKFVVCRYPIFTACLGVACVSIVSTPFIVAYTLFF